VNDSDGQKAEGTGQKPDGTRRKAEEGRLMAVNSDKVLCERCSAEMFRMHAVWRCPSCGYKTDCCGW
jgi:ribosomal protein L37AE/L43A